MAKRITKRKAWWIAAATAFVTAIVCLLVINFIGPEKKLQRRIERHYALEDPRFMHELGVLLGPGFVDGNRLTHLQNGDEIFPSMLAAIRSARTSISFETYIYWSGDIGQEFAEALSERVRHGVKVHVLLDWVGSAKLDKRMVDEMNAHGVKVEIFHPPRWSQLGRMNNRTHRKLLIIDGKVAFTGGVGVAPQWTGNAQSPEHWRDSHFKIEGPAVAQLQAVFMDNWIKTTGEVLLGPDYFPVLAPVGHSLAQAFSSSPTGGSESMALMYQLAITAASRTIDLSASYFVPDEMTRLALLAAIKRGVRVRIVLPGEHMDSDTVQSASRANWGPLLQAGAVIAEYVPTMFHCKVMIVDGLLTSVGSTNFDNRSFRLNDEATLNIFDGAFAAAETAIFERDLALARRVSYAEWQARPWHEKLVERVTATLLGSQL